MTIKGKREDMEGTSENGDKKTERANKNNKSFQGERKTGNYLQSCHFVL